MNLKLLLFKRILVEFLRVMVLMVRLEFDLKQVTRNSWSFFQKGINYVTDSTLLQIGKRVEVQRSITEVRNIRLI